MVGGTLAFGAGALQTPSAAKYPSNQGPSAAKPPAGREYIPTDISKLPASVGLNDLFQFLDTSKGANGKVTTPEEWRERRAEIADLVQYYYYGYRWPTRKQDVSFSASKNSAGAALTSDGELTVTVKNPDTGVSANILVTGVFVPVYNPDKADDADDGTTNIAPPYPFIIGVGGGISAVQRNGVLSRGYAVLSLNTASVYSDNESRSGAYTTLYPFNKDVYEYNSGALMAWSWGISRVIDALENGAYSGLIDPAKSAVTGVSRNGKAALLAAAFDERILVGAPCDSGQSGVSSFRYNSEGKLYNYNVPTAMNRVYSRNEKPTNVLSTGEAHWLDVKAEEFRYNLSLLPFDSHAIEAMVAPRPLISWCGEEFDWTAPPASVQAFAAAKEVFEFLGVGDDIAIRVRDASHALQDRDVPFLLAITEREFRGEAGAPLVVEDIWPQGLVPVATANNPNPLAGPPTYNEAAYERIADFTSYPYEIDSSYIRWSRPSKYTLWTNNELLTEGFPTRVIAYSDAPSVTLTLPDGATLSADTQQGAALFDLSAEQVQVGRYVLSTDGADKDSKTVYFQGMDLTTALRHGATKNNSNGSPILGFTSKINHDAIKIYANGTLVEASPAEGEADGWLLRYGVKVRTEVPQDVIRLTGLKMEALPGYTFDISYLESALTEAPTWNATTTKIGPSPDWPVYPNSLSDDGARDSRPAAQAGPNTVSVSTGDTASVATHQITLTFSAALDKNDFGIGFDFTERWNLSWSADGKTLTVDFDNSALYAGRQCSIAVIRGNGITAPVIHTFTIF
jgi:hypothetical protein